MAKHMYTVFVTIGFPFRIGNQIDTEAIARGSINFTHVTTAAKRNSLKSKLGLSWILSTYLCLMYIGYEVKVLLPIYKMPCFRGLDLKTLHYMLFKNFQARLQSGLCIDRLPKLLLHGELGFGI